MLTEDIKHRDGVPWHEAPIPRRLHRCSAQTTAWVDFRKVERCACGAIRVDDHWWFERNTRKRNR